MTLTAPGGMNNKFIWKMFTNMIRLIIGPSNISTKTNSKVLSNIPRSFENLFVNLPVGVMSK